MQHFLTVLETSRDDLEHVIDVAYDLREQRRVCGGNDPVLAHKTLVMIFEKPSLRTRVSFEQAMVELGGHAIMLRSTEVGIGSRESAADIARVLNGMVHGVMARVFEHQKLIDLSASSDIPVINALSDQAHPCQAVADLMTMMDEFGRDLKGRTLAFIGDGNNVARSLAVTCGLLGIRFTLACPSGYEFEESFIKLLHDRYPKNDWLITSDPAEAVKEADAVYTDTWVSMGQEEEAESRKAAFSRYQINDELLGATPPHAIVLHCLPAYRGLEITERVIDGPRSRVFPQAHNRMHAQKGLLAVLLAGA